jgi:hypothetical protein
MQQRVYVLLRSKKYEEPEIVRVYLNQMSAYAAEKKSWELTDGYYYFLEEHELSE